MTVRALIVDDNLEYLRIARVMLEREGFEVVDVASNGLDALRFARRHRPDVVLIDVDLAGESGFDVADDLSCDRMCGAIVMISAYPEQDLLELLQESPAIGFVSKSELSAKGIVALLSRVDPDRD